jgi:putative sigma-54 modulation protein
MKIDIQSKSYSPNDHLKDLITKKIARLDKFFDDSVDIRVMLKQTKEIYTLELTIVLDSIVLRSEVSSDNMFGNIDIAIPKLEKQIIKHHAKINSRIQRGIKLVDVVQPDEQPAAIVRTKSHRLASMNVDTAIAELELVGHSFYLFSNELTNKVNAVYKRLDGDYGVIEVSN